MLITLAGSRISILYPGNSIFYLMFNVYFIITVIVVYNMPYCYLYSDHIIVFCMGLLISLLLFLVFTDFIRSLDSVFCNSRKPYRLIFNGPISRY